MIVLSLLPFLFYELGILTEPFVSLIALAASVFLFVGDTDHRRKKSICGIKKEDFM